MKSSIYGVLSRQTVAKVKGRISSVLSRPVLTESDKKTIQGLGSLVLSESRTKTIHQAKAQILARARKQALSDFVRGVSRHLRGLFPDYLESRLFTGANKNRAFLVVNHAGVAYAKFRHWLKKPVTVGTALTVMAVWTLAITFTRFQPPWSEVGLTSGLGAIFMTAVLTARLTVNSQKLWLERPGRQEPSREVNRWLIETALARRTMVVHEIEEFLSSGRHAYGKEVNLKTNTFLMRKRDWQSLQDALYDTFLKGAPPLLFELGHRLGSSIGSDMMRRCTKPSAVLAELEDVSRALGWGIVSVHGDLTRGSRLTFIVQESPFCVTESPLEKNTYSCHMLCGMMSGIVEEVYGWPCTAFEQKCARDGHDACAVVVTQDNAPQTRRDKWNLSVLFPVLHPWRR